MLPLHLRDALDEYIRLWTIHLSGSEVLFGILITALNDSLKPCRIPPEVLEVSLVVPNETFGKAF